MRNFQEVLEEEIRDQKGLMRQADRVLSHAPEGYLQSRPRKDSVAFYQGGSHLGRTRREKHYRGSAVDKGLVSKAALSGDSAKSGEESGGAGSIEDSLRSRSYSGYSADIVKRLQRCGVPV